MGGGISFRINIFFSPLDRLEPGIVMIDFIREIVKDKKRVDDDLYLTKEEYEGDNSDNGNWVIDLNE